MISKIKDSWAVSLAQILIQAILLYYFTAYRNLIIIYLFLFLIGLSIYSFSTPSFLKARHNYFILLPMYGLIIISIIGSFFISLDISIKLLAPVVLIVGFISVATQLIFKNRDLSSLALSPKKESKQLLLTWTFIITPIVFCLISPVLLASYPTSTFRIGPDMALYAKMCQYFLDGGTWSHAALRAGGFVGMSAGEINRYSDATMTWPEMLYFRWGLTAYQATVAVVTLTHHSFETAFLSMAIPYILMSGFILIWLRNQFKLSVIASVLGSVAFLFNANSLNLWYEGFFGNGFALTFFIPILFVFIHHRTTNNIEKKDLIKSIAFLSILVAASLSSYAEGVFFVLTIFVVFIFIIDLIFHRGKIKWSSYFMLLTCGIMGLIIVLPCGFFLDWLSLALRQVTEEGGNGYHQPYWAFPSEIIGFQNIYFNATVEMVNKGLHRSWSELFFVSSFSLVILYSIYFYIIHRTTTTIVYVASLAMVVVFGAYIYYKSPLNNYGYMKMYVFHLPFLFILFWGSLSTFIDSKLGNFLRPWPTATFVIACVPIVFVGLVYIKQYINTGYILERQRISLHEELREIDFEKVVIYPAFVTQVKNRMLYHKIMYPAVLPAVWMVPSRWTEKKCYSNFNDFPVYLFIEKRPMLHFGSEIKSIVFENKDYIIINSNKKVGDGLNTDKASINFEVFTAQLINELNEQTRNHNSEVGLPLDFDPLIYLELNPDIQKYWLANGINEDGAELRLRAELHYLGFGKKDERKYQDALITPSILVFEK